MSKILFVCLGNICRSPTAEGVLRARALKNNLTGLHIDSAGTGDWHIGDPPDPRATQIALQRGYDIAHLRARQVTSADFARFTHILAMDRNNLSDLQTMAPDGHGAELRLFLDYAGTPNSDVPDPYFGGADGFNPVLDLIEFACDGLLDSLKN